MKTWMIGMVVVIAQVVSAAARAPNIVLIVSDDQGYGDCSAYPGHAPDIQTANLDRIARGGVRFSSGYVSAPVCSPSRTGLLTGRYQQRWSKQAGWVYELPKSVPTIAERLKQAGYATLYLGKNDYGHPLASREDRRYPMRHGFDQYLGFSGHAHDYFQLTREIEEQTPDPHETSANIGALDFNDTFKSISEGYTTDLFTDHAIEFLKSHPDQPVFIVVAYNAVHDIVQQVPKKYLDRYGVSPIPLYDPKTMGKYVDYYNSYNRLGKTNETEMRKYLLANLACLDENVGRLLDAMDALKQTENTLITFISDNGGSPNTGGDNRPLRASKYTLFEGGIRVPLMMRWPAQVKAGEVSDRVVSSLDLMPTFLQAAGVNTDEMKLDGESLTSNGAGERTLFWKFQKQWAVRKGDWKLVKSRQSDGKDGRVQSWIIKGPSSDKPQLFNLKDDLAEQKDVSERHPEIVKELTQAYQKWDAANGLIERE
ncbi:MAG TPA: sulfatase-like hydrolase/transferase [Tepidisphaeraceae bacterium]|jgi:arylsulfatase A-like enzyme